MRRPQNAGAGPPPCGLLRRLAAMGYDAVVLAGLLLVAAALASPFDAGKQHALRDPGFTLYLLAAWFAYFAICWQRAGMTLGMRAWRIRVVAEAGGRIGWRSSLVRFTVAWLSAGAAGLGFAWSLGDAQRRCWHDLASRTRLVVWRSD